MVCLGKGAKLFEHIIFDEMIAVNIILVIKKRKLHSVLDTRAKKQDSAFKFSLWEVWQRRPPDSSWKFDRSNKRSPPYWQIRYLFPSSVFVLWVFKKCIYNLYIIDGSWLTVPHIKIDKLSGLSHFLKEFLIPMFQPNM